MTKTSVSQLVGRANYLAKNGEFSEAENLYAEVLKSFPNNKKALQGLRDLRRVSRTSFTGEPPKQVINQLISNFKEEKLALVVKQVNNLLAHYPKAIALWNILGISSAQAGQFDQAIAAFEQIITFTPNQASAYYNLGNVLKDKGQIQQAVDAYTKALELKPNYEEAFNNLTVALASQDQNAGKHQVGVIDRYHELRVQGAKKASEYFKSGLILQQEGKLDEAIRAYKKSIEYCPEFADTYKSLGDTLQEQGKLEEAVGAYSKALAIKPDYVEAFNNMGIALKDQGIFEEAIEAFKKALEINPDYAMAYNNLGIALKDHGILEEAAEAFKKALAINPDYAMAYNNLGNALKDQGILEEAVEAFENAVAIKPDYAEAHRNLSTVTKYNSEMAQISAVKALLKQTDLNRSDQCNLLYTHAKMSEDLEDLRSAFDSYVAGGDLRQKLLGYNFTQDERMFARIKKTAQKFKDVALIRTEKSIRHTPIFILGMPRSGTTLVEQIISSHSTVTGAGELPYVSRFGTNLVTGRTATNSKAISVFREQYLTMLAKRADGQAFITDKMPQNFGYIAVICAALPEVKIVHVQRNSKATCWSNFKHYFASKGLGYSYNLSDTVKYYGLYKDLMQFWYQSYDDRIYNLDYDKLTENQELETRLLIEYLGLDWEDACLAPQKNKRSVGTASNQQVRRKVYTGSSEAWRKYEPFLHGIFDELEA